MITSLICRSNLPCSTFIRVNLTTNKSDQFMPSLTLFLLAAMSEIFNSFFNISNKISSFYRTKFLLPFSAKKITSNIYLLYFFPVRRGIGLFILTDKKIYERHKKFKHEKGILAIMAAKPSKINLKFRPILVLKCWNENVILKIHLHFPLILQFECYLYIIDRVSVCPSQNSQNRPKGLWGARIRAPVPAKGWQPSMCRPYAGLHASVIRA